jgi:autotransporter translocation and assembly factor TamB
MTSDSNKIDAHGLYLIKEESVDADLLLDIQNPEQFAFLYSGMLEDVHGSIQGEAKITGPASKPEVKGFIQFKETGITTLNPRFKIKIKDDKILLENSGIFFDHLTLYDTDDHPLTIDGNLVTKDYTTYTYDLQIKTDQFALINTPPDTKTTMKGLLSIGTDISLKGNGKDTEVKANIIVQDTTHLIYVLTSNEDDLLNTIGNCRFYRS